MLKPNRHASEQKWMFLPLDAVNKASTRKINCTFISSISPLVTKYHVSGSNGSKPLFLANCSKKIRIFFPSLEVQCWKGCVVKGTANCDEAIWRVRKERIGRCHTIQFLWLDYGVQVALHQVIPRHVMTYPVYFGVHWKRVPRVVFVGKRNNITFFWGNPELHVRFGYWECGSIRSD